VESAKGKEVIVVDSSTESEDETDPQSKKSLSRKSQDSPRDQFHSSLPEDVLSSPVQSASPLSAVGSITAEEGRGTILWSENTIKVVSLVWFEKSRAAGYLLPLNEYLIYEGRQVPRHADVSAEPTITEVLPSILQPYAGLMMATQTKNRSTTAESILARAAADSPKTVSTPFSKSYGHRKQRSETPITRPTHLIHQTTSEHDDPTKFPPMPLWLHNTYSCQRPTPLTSPNNPFISQLKKIKHARELRGDEIGIRAYSTAIASIAAYPYPLSSPQEILRLPGCSGKYATLFEEWKETGHCLEADKMDTDEQLKVMDLFWNIWGVGPGGARDFLW